MSNGPKRQIIKTGFALWTNLPSTVVWFEAGKNWAGGLIEGNWWERTARDFVLSLTAPGFGTAMSFVLEFYRSKLRKYVGPNGIWVAVKVLNPDVPAGPPRVYAKKRTGANKLKTPDPWEPTTWNVL
jgi:hypothetical protein